MYESDHLVFVLNTASSFNDTLSGGGLSMKELTGFVLKRTWKDQVTWGPGGLVKLSKLIIFK